MKTIYFDAMLASGKYKGQAVEDVLHRDPGYFLWCEVAGAVKLSPEVKSVVTAWAQANPDDAKRTRKSAEKRVSESKSRGETITPISSAAPGSFVKGEAPPAPKREAVSIDHAEWGTW